MKITDGELKHIFNELEIKKFTNRKLALFFGVTVTTVSRWRNGVSAPGDEERAKLRGIADGSISTEPPAVTVQQASPNVFKLRIEPVPGMVVEVIVTRDGTIDIKK